MGTFLGCCQYTVYPPPFGICWLTLVNQTKQEYRSQRCERPESLMEVGRQQSERTQGHAITNTEGSQVSSAIY